MSSQREPQALRVAESGTWRGAADRLRAHARDRIGAAGMPVRLSVAGIVLIALALTVAAWTYTRIGQVVRLQVAKVLKVTRDSASEGALLWFEGASQAASAAARDPRLAAPLAECLQGNSCGQATIEELLAPYLRSVGFTRFRLSDRNGRVALGGPHRGVAADLSSALVARTSQLRAGDVVIAPPLPDEPHASMSVLAAVGDGGREPAGALVFELPMTGLGQVLVAARGGASGETYAFDARGRLLTESRFDAQLHQIGMLKPSEHASALAFELRDPGGDLTQNYHPSRPRTEWPLTYMVADAIRGHAGCNPDGYRDYRGVSVVGAWRWLPELGIGIGTELDTDEALQTLRTLRRLFGWMVGGLGASVVALLIAMAVAARMRQRALRAEQRADRYGQYRIVRSLGQGGMGRVYLAHHALLRRPAAIKVLRPDRATPEALASFEHEVQITSTLTHPNTVAVYDYGRSDEGALYYVMEYLEGLDLQRLVTMFGALPPARVLHVLRQLCASLVEAHEAGLVHRDIKPANLLMCTRGGMVDTLKVLDFGLAHLTTGTRMSGAQDRWLVGTPEYMAPEMFESTTQASVQSDLYSVGCVGYFLLTARPPFDAETTTGLGLAHMTETPRAPSVRLGSPVDATLERAIMLCLSKRREGRPASARSLASLLERSALLGVWTQDDAERWWLSRGPNVDAVRSSDAATSETPPPAHVRRSITA